MLTFCNNTILLKLQKVPSMIDFSNSCQNWKLKLIVKWTLATKSLARQNNLQLLSRAWLIRTYQAQQKALRYLCSAITKHISQIASGNEVFFVPSPANRIATHYPKSPISVQKVKHNLIWRKWVTRITDFRWDFLSKI